MIAGRVVRVSGLGTGAVRQFSCRSHRHLSSFARNTTNSFRSTPRAGYGLASASSKLSAFSPITHSALGVRFASSSTPAAAAPDVSSIPDTNATSTFMSDPSLLDDISTIPEKMGYLKEIGLDFGWGPSSLIETFLEAFHIYGGLPWWGSAVATAVLIRVAMVPIMYKGNQMTIRMKEAKDVTEPLRQRMLEAFRTDPSQAMVLKGELDAVKRTYGIQAKWMFLPLLQIPLGIGGFRVMRAMADLPVPSLESESVLWLYDVTMADPYYVLPVALAVVTWRTITINQQFNTTEISNPIVKQVVNILPPIVFATASFLPGIVQLSFLTTGAISLLQTSLMASPAFRRIVRLPPLPLPHRPKEDPKPTPTDQNISWIDRMVNRVKSQFKPTVDYLRGATEGETAKRQQAASAKQIEHRKRLAEEERATRNLMRKREFERRRKQTRQTQGSKEP